jgi:nucleoside-diphosphate-sugar epimerase
MEKVAEVLGKKVRSVYVPAAALQAIGSGADAVTRLFGKRLPINRKLARQLLAPGWTCSIEKAKSRLGYRPRHTLADSITRSAKSYVDAGWL